MFSEGGNQKTMSAYVTVLAAGPHALCIGTHKNCNYQYVNVYEYHAKIAACLISSSLFTGHFCPKSLSINIKLMIYDNITYEQRYLKFHLITDLTSTSSTLNKHVCYSKRNYLMRHRRDRALIITFYEET